MVQTTVKGLLTDLRDVAMDLEAIGLQLERAAIPPVVDAGRLVTRKAGRLAALLEAACQQTRAGDGEHHQLRLRLV